MDVKKFNMLKLPNLHIKTNLLSGFGVLLPLIAVILVVNVFAGFAKSILSPILPLIPETSSLTGVVSVAIALVVFYFAGLAAKYTIGKKIIRVVRGINNRIPVLGSVYKAAQKFIEFFSQREISGTIVMVPFSVLVGLPYRPGEGSLFYALLMSDSRVRNVGVADIVVSDKTHAAVFVSSSPLPQSGQIAIVPKDKIFAISVSRDSNPPQKNVHMTMGEYFELIASVGTISPKIIDLRPYYR